MSILFTHQAPYEKTTRDTWLMFKLMADFVDGFEILKDVDPAVSIFGSARFGPKTKYWKMTERVAAAVTSSGYSLISGGGPGLMEASNKGARLGIKKFVKKNPQQKPPSSIGLNIQLPFETHGNPYLDIEINFKYFFVRKVMFARYACAFVILPGGFGTMDELFEALTLVQTKKMEAFPIILMGKKYWGGMTDWIKKTLISERAISKADLNFFRVTDDPEEVVRIIQASRPQARASSPRPPRPMI